MKPSKKNELSKSDLILWSQNLLKFTAPGLAVFFSQLAMGVNLKAAGLVALLDLF